MRAVVAEGGQLDLREVPEPEPGVGQVLIRVHAAGLNAADHASIRGAYVVGDSVRPPVAAAGRGPVPMGAEAAGEVVAIGPGVTVFAPGDRVMAGCRGAFADFAVAEVGRTMPVPAGMPWPEAAGTPITFVTAHDALVTAGGLRPGDAVLVNAASSGVGVAALQLARLLGAGTVIASSTSPAKFDRLAAAGVGFALGVVAGAGDFADQVIDATGGAGVTVIVDNVGASAWPENLAVAALGARIVNVGRLGGQTAPVNLDEVARKRVSLVGVTFRTRSTAQAAAVFAAAAADVLPALADGRLRVLVDRTFPLAEAAAAERYLLDGKHLGKVVLVNDRDHGI